MGAKVGLGLKRLLALEQIATFYCLAPIVLVDRFVTSHGWADRQCKYLQSQKCYYIAINLISIMAELKDEQALLLLLKAPKKKYIKHLLEYSACLELYHNCPPPNFKTPLIETFQSDLELTTEQSHRLLLSLSNLVSTAFALNFNFSSSSPFSQQFDPQLKQILLQSLTALQSQLSESRLDTMRMGNKLVDINWKLDLQVASQKGKANIPSVSIEIQSVNQTAGLEREKIWMRGQQFLAFFGNLGKIRESLLGLVGEKKEGQGRNGGQVK